MALHRRQVLQRVLALAAGGSLAGCVSGGPGGPPDRDPYPSPPATPEGDVRQLTLGTTRFALDLHGHLTDDAPGDNLLFSPHSIAVALAMTYAGATGETRTQLRETLRFALDDEALHPAYRELDASLSDRETIGSYEPPTATESADGERGEVRPFELVDANSVWGQDGFPFRGAYLDLLEAHYGSGLRTVDFESDPEEARTAINGWVAETTREKIPTLLPPDALSTLTRLVLVNAVYFRARWQHQFDSTSTDLAFAALDGTTTEVPKMWKAETYPYAEVDGHQLVELPYVAQDLGMVLVVPAEGTFESFEAELTADRLRGLLGAMEERPGTVTMPKFTFRSEFQLKRALSALGMPAPFDRAEADFSRMTDGPLGERLFVDDVYHEAFVGVDERGTEAAAATGVVVRLVSKEITQTPPFELTVDRPFLFLIRDARTGAILFLGRVVDAGAAVPEG